jgi:hypothetical protein
MHKNDQQYPIWKVQEVQVGHDSNHLFTCIKSPIQPVVAQTIHHAQGLSMDNLTFDPHTMRNHVLCNLSYATKKCPLELVWVAN